MKKKIVTASALLLVFVLSLSGCGSSTVSPIETAVPSTVETLPTETLPIETEPPVIIGNIDGNTYTNSYAGFGCTLDSDWTFSSAGELQQLRADISDATGFDLEAFMESHQQFTEMKAENEKFQCSINVLYQKQSAESRRMFSELDESEIIDMAVKLTGDRLRDTYSKMGVNVLELKRTEVTFLGETHSALYTRGSSQGTTMYMLQFMDFSHGSYSLTTTFVCYGKDRINDMLELFFPVD